MDPSILLGILVAWAVVTLLGHGTWLMLAKLFGPRKPAPPQSPAEGIAPRSTCPRCRSWLGTGTNACKVCGWPGSRADSEAALRSLRQQLAHLHNLNALDAEAYQTLATAIKAEEEQLAAAMSTRRMAPAAAPDLSITLTPLEPAAEPTKAAPISAVRPETSAVPAALAPSGSPTERVQKYMESRTTAAAEPIPVVAPPPKKREAISRLFAAFMEEKNIRWGELVGGLLIVGCSIALVISFWSEIAARPMLKFVLFGGVTAALFGVGLYTDRRWKIHTTSHGLLLVATLLVPLNFLAIAAFTQGLAANDAVTLAGEAVSLVVFSLLVYLAARVIVPDAAMLLTAGVMVPSLMQLLIRRWVEPSTTLAVLYGLAFVPIAWYVASVAAIMRRRFAEPALNEENANRVFRFFGTLSAATFFPLALLAAKVPPLEAIVHHLSPLLVWCGVPGLLMGLLFWKRMTDWRSTAAQTAGLAVGVFGAAMMVGSVVAAWPDPATLLPVAAMNLLAFVIVAFWFGIPAALIPAGLALAGAWLIGFHYLRGNVAWTLPDYKPMSQALLSAVSGHALLPLVAFFGMASWSLKRLARWEESVMVGLVCAATALASLALVLWFGFARSGDPEGATWALFIYAVAALAAATVIDRPDLAWTGATLLLLALVQAIVYRWGGAWQLERPRIVALLVHASLMVAGLVVIDRWVRRHVHLRNAFQWWALVSSAAAAGLLAGLAPSTSAATLAAYVAWLAVVWCALAWLSDWPALFTASQIAAALAIFAAVTASVEGRDWYAAAPHPWLDPWFLEAQGIALAGFCLLVEAMRRGFARVAERRAEHVVELPPPRWLATGQRCFDPAWPAVDRALEVALLALFVLVAGYSALPGAAQELAPLEAARGSGAAVRVVTPIEEFEIPGIAHEHAASGGAWLLGVGVLAAVAIGIGQRHRVSLRWQGLVVAATMVCPLLAAQWEAEVAVASALRWMIAGFFALASVPLWLSWTRIASADVKEVTKPIRDLLVAIVVLVYVAMGAYVAQAALRYAGMPTDSPWPYLLAWAVVAAAVAVAIPLLATIFEGKQLGGVENSTSWMAPMRSVLLVAAIGPLAVLYAFAAARALDQHPIVGPEPASWFRSIGWDVSYGVPLAAIALVFVGHAIRWRSSRFAFSAGLLANVVATLVALMRLARGGGVLNAVAWVTVGQINAIVAGIVALVWLAAVTWDARRRGAKACGELGRAETGRQGEIVDHAASLSSWPLLLITQVVLAGAFCAAFLAPATAKLAIEPQSPAAWSAQAGGMTGWLALALATAAAIWSRWRGALGQGAVAVFVAALVAMTAVAAIRWDTGNLVAYHTLLIGCAAASWLMPLATRSLNGLIGDARVTKTSTLWSLPAVRLFAVAAVVLAIRGYVDNSTSFWWTVVVLTAISARNVWIAWYESRRGFMWIAAVLANVAASIWWGEVANQLTATRGPGEVTEFLWVNVLAAATMALVSVGIGLRADLAAVSEGEPRRGIAFHRFAAWAIVATLLLTTGGGLLTDWFTFAMPTSAVLGWSAWLAAAVVALASCWDRAVRWPVACLYMVGLLGVGLYLDGLNFAAPMFHWALANALAAYSLATSYLWSRREGLRTAFAKWGVPGAINLSEHQSDTADFESRRDSTMWAGSGHGWLVPANLLSAIAVLLLVGWIEITMPEFARRMIAAYAIGAEALAIGLLARGAVRSALQYTALVFGALFAVAFGWAWLPPDFPAPWLHRTVAAIAALAITTVVYGLGLVKLLKRENEWTRAAQRLVPLLAVIAAALLLLVLTMEVVAFVDKEPVPVSWWALLAVAASLVGLAIAALVAALVPGRDPLRLSERGRTVYVYAAEALAALTFLHIRVTMPWLFSGWFLRFWPLVVMAIAFVGVGLGEFFQRRRQRVLAEPLSATGVLLPLLPALGFWITSSEVHYSLLLLSAGVLYAAMSVLRKSFLLAVLSALAVNGGLWYLLYTKEGFGLTDHPQLWLIPPALCVLVASYLNRARLTPEQTAAIRYGSAIVIYASSTVDIFINGVADAPWLPAVLAALSILGVFAGILLRMQSFLILGTVFLVVAIMTIIYHAAIEQERTWILWVAGIVTGVLIIALFGLFEKRRDDVLRMVDRLKQWEA